MGLSPHLCFLDAKERLLRQNIKSLWVPDLTCRLCIQNIMISIRNTSLYVSQPSCVVFEFKTARFATELHASVGPRPHLLFCACKTACLALELLVSMYPSPHLWSLIAKQRLLAENYKSLWVPDLTCRLVHAKQHD